MLLLAMLVMRAIPVVGVAVVMVVRLWDISIVHALGLLLAAVLAGGEAVMALLETIHSQAPVMGQQVMQEVPEQQVLRATLLLL